MALWIDESQRDEKDFSKLKFYNRAGKEIKFKRRPIEKKILPLVKALNATKLVKTFSSCEGHWFLLFEQKVKYNILLGAFRFGPLVSSNAAIISFGIDKINLNTYLL